MFCKTENDTLQPKLYKKDVQKILSDALYLDLMKIEPETMSDNTLFGFFKRCYTINKVISKQ